MPSIPERAQTQIDPRPPFPCGWQGIAFSEEILPGQILSRHILGQDWVLFRGQTGNLTVAAAYCPHLGAHLGDGAVIDDQIRCPYHHWQFDANGRCSAIPYGTKKPERARLETLPVKEINGFVFVWFHPGGIGPHWQIPSHPVVDDPDYYFVDRRSRMFRAHPQDIAENGADFAHFTAVHGWDQVSLVFTPEGSSYRVGYDTSEVDTGYGERGAVGVDSLTVGPGYTYTHYTGPQDWLMMTCHTPVDAGMLYMQHLYYARRDIPRPQAMALLEAVDGEWLADIRIWQSKCYREIPVLNDGDGPIARFRRWYAQFYPDAEDA